ncbi:hypothetical protein D3C79_701330 [compost metagenome]
MLTLNLTIDGGRWHRNHRRIIFDALNARVGQAVKQAPVKGQHTLVQIDVGKVRDIGIATDNAAEKALTVAASNESTKEVLIAADA